MKRTATLWAAVLGLVAAAQAQVLIRVQQENNITQVSNGGTVQIPSTGPGAAKAFQLTITYTGTTSLGFPGPPQLLGSQDFSITSVPPANTILAPGQSVTVQLRYLPSSSRQASAELDYGFLQAAPQVPNQPQPPPVPGLVIVGLLGSSPDYSLSYSLAIDGNTVNLAPNGVLVFTDTIANSATLATMGLLNRGSGTGQVLSVTTTGEAFSLGSLPLVPAFLQPGASLPFQLRYRPRQAGADLGTLTLTFEGGTSYTVRLQGKGIVSYLTYELLAPDDAARPIAPGQPVVLPATPVGERTTTFVRLRNSSELDIVVGAIAISGNTFQLEDLPFLPVTMAPGDTQLFSIVFAPTQAGRQTGRLRVGNDSFDLIGSGVGPVLTYSYRNPGGTTTIQPLGNVVFPAVQVGGSVAVDFTVRNTGTAAAPLVNVAIVSDGTPVYTLSGLPALPASIPPNGAVTFTIRFAPLNTNLSSASLRINGDAFALVGTGSQPAPLPEYTIQGPTAVQPFEQPTVGLTLGATYPVALTGKLTLTTESDSYASDPAVQFVTGGRVASFTIPAGATQAVFSSGSTRLKFQTGSVAGTILITPSFATEGGLELTPKNPVRLQASLPASEPKLVSLTVDSRTSNGFVLQVTGYATTRSISKMTVKFTTKAGYNFGQTEFTQDLTASSFVWFNSQASVAFGGQFLISFPFSVTSSDTATGALPPIQTLESATVTVTNERGTSNAVTAQIQ